MNLNPRILLKLNQVRTPNDAAQIWQEHWRELEGWQLVLSENNVAERRFRWPARLDLQGKGFLRSAFAHDSLWFTNSEILAAISQGRKVDILVDYSIGFDLNTATYLLATVEGRKPEIVQVFQGVLRGLAGAKFNWDVLPYLDERFEDVMAERDRDAIFRTILSTERFAACDHERFASTGDIFLPEGEAGPIAKSHELLAMHHQVLMQGKAERLRGQHRTILAIVLKIAALERLYPGPQHAARKLARVIEFMHNRLHCLMFLLIWAAGEYFRLGGAFRPLRKLSRNTGSELDKAASNIAWDFRHVLSRQSMSANIGHEGSFHVPYLLTFDRDIAALYDGFPQRSCLVGPDNEGPYFIAERSLDLYLFGHWPGLKESIGWVFLEDIRAERLKMHETASVDLVGLLAELRSDFGFVG